jgi:hypothetical protein
MYCVRVGGVLSKVCMCTGMLAVLHPKDGYHVLRHV